MKPAERVAAWTVGLTVAAVLIVTGVAGMTVVRYGPLHARPWAFVFLVAAALGALLGLVLAMIKARDIED